MQAVTKCSRLCRWPGTTVNSDDHGNLQVTRNALWGMAHMRQQLSRYLHVLQPSDGCISSYTLTVNTMQAALNSPMLAAHYCWQCIGNTML